MWKPVICHEKGWFQIGPSSFHSVGSLSTLRSARGRYAGTLTYPLMSALLHLENQLPFDPWDMLLLILEHIS